MLVKYYIFCFYTKVVNSRGELLYDKPYRKGLQVSLTDKDEDILTKSTYDKMAQAVMLEILNLITNPNLTPSAQAALTPDWEKSEIIPIGIYPCYQENEETTNDQIPSNI